MARITINDVKTSLGLNNTYDILNAIRNENGFEQYVPLANKDNLAEVGAGIMINQTLQNDFITALVDRIGLVVVGRKLMTNPLSRFKKGMLPMGRTIEEIFTDLAKEQLFDQETAEDEVFKREIPDVKVLFHEVNRKSFYKQTISQEQLTQAFTSTAAFDNFISSIVRAMYNAAEVDEYKYMKMLIENYYSKGLFKVVPVLDPVDGASAEEFIKQLRAMSTKLSLPMGSRDYNAMGVHTLSDTDSLHLFIDADLNASVDVDVLAKAFNMNKADFIGSVTVIDGFASQGLLAVLVDEDFFMVYDRLLKSETIRNPQGLYWNQFFHVQQVLSASRFANAVAFVTGAVKEVTAVILDKTLVSLKAGKSLEYTAYVRQTDKVDHEVVWAVVAGDSLTTVEATTTISQDGVLTLAESQRGQLKLTATVTVGANVTVGEAIVHVIPK